VASKFREARDEAGNLTYARGEGRFHLIEHLPVINVVSGEQGCLRDLAHRQNSARAVVTAHG
jgi:hypothetical protein